MQPNSENPYLGMVALADFAIVTEDSISMVSECVTSGKPTYIFPADTKQKTQTLHPIPNHSGKARILKDENLQTYEYEPLNTLKFIIQKIRELI